MAFSLAASTSAAVRPAPTRRAAMTQARVSLPRTLRPVRTFFTKPAPSLRHSTRVQAAQEGAIATGQATSEGALKELTKDDFQQYLDDAPHLVVVDFYTDWCGPCKIILPKLIEMNAEYGDVEIVKFNCNQYNKELGKQLGIRVAPTFHLYKGGNKVAEMTGAKPDKLRELMDQYK